jgi:hypothetical protein
LGAGMLERPIGPARGIDHGTGLRFGDFLRCGAVRRMSDGGGGKSTVRERGRIYKLDGMVVSPRLDGSILFGWCTATDPCPGPLRRSQPSDPRGGGDNPTCAAVHRGCPIILVRGVQ